MQTSLPPYCPFLTIMVLMGRHGDLRACLSSLFDDLHSYELLIGDQGMSPEDIKVAKEFGSTPIPVPADRSEARNLLLTKVHRPHVVHIEPWERMVSGTLLDVGDQSEPTYAFRVVREDVVSVETRVWRHDPGIKYRNPVFETNGMTGGRVVATVVADEPPGPDMEALKKWVNRCPTLPEARYFHACGLLASGNAEQFLTEASQYIFMERSKSSAMPVTMTRYYMGLVALSRKDAQEAIRMAVACLAVRPTMSEFWCLAADAHYHVLQAYDRAMELYENALVLGSRRRSDDDWPMQVSKCRDYPQRMMASCRGIISGSVSQQRPHQVH